MFAERTKDIIVEVNLHPDLQYMLLSLLLSFSISLWKYRIFSFYYSPFPLFSFLLAGPILVYFLVSAVPIVYCDAHNAFSPPSPPQLPEEPQPLPESPPVIQQPIIPELPQPLLSDEMRSAILYRRYLLLNWGGDPDLRRMVSIIDAQVIVERYVEAALVDDGFTPQSISDSSRELRGFVHTPRGELLSARTYGSYVTQIREHGTRASVPYRRVIRAVQNYDLLLERRR